MNKIEDQVMFKISDHPLYHALRSNNTEHLSELFKSAETDTKSLLSLLSQTYEEVKLKNLPLTPETQCMVETKLMDLQFVRNDTKSQTDDFKTSFNGIKDHLRFTSELISSFLDKYLNNPDFEVNMEFIFHARYIGQHISVLKRRMTYSYEILPWEEIQFCLAIYLHLLLNPENMDIIYKLIINRKRMLSYLSHFHSKLNEIKSRFKEEDLQCKIDPRRNLIKEAILQNSPEFEDLYQDFSLLRDIHSLEKINFYIDIGLDIHFEENVTKGQLMIERTLQVIGEYIKNTPQSPNISDNLYKSLLRSAPRNLRVILSRLRNMLSHSFSLNRKLELEGSKDPELFRKIQIDLQKIQINILYILYKQKIEAVKVFLNRLLDATDSEEVTSIFKQSGIRHFREVNDYEINLEEFLKVKTLVTLFCEKVLEDSSEESEAINEVLKTLKRYENKIKDVSFTYGEAINKVYSLFNTNKNLDVIKNMVRTYVSNLSASEPQNLYDDVYIKLRNIHEDYNIRVKYDAENFLGNNVKAIEIGRILIEISIYLTWRLRKIKWIEEMEDVLTLKEDKSEKENKAGEIFQMVHDKMGSKEDKILVNQSVKKAQQQHRIKYELMALLDEDAAIFHAKVTSLGLSPKRQKDILYNHEHRKHDKLLRMIKEIDDSYGTFLKNLADMFPLPKYINPIKAFYKSLKFKAQFQRKLDQAIDDAINEEVRHCYCQRLKTLDLCLTSITDVTCIRNKIDLKISLEMLVLDLLEFLKNVGLLCDNKMFLVQASPILISTQLRNYLAHGDILTDILPYDQEVAIIFHAVRLVELGESILSEKGVVLGYNSDNHSFSFQNYFEKCLYIINNQLKLFVHAKNGNIAEIQKIIEAGADFSGINYNGWTALDFAISSNNQAIFKHLMQSYCPMQLGEAYRLFKLAAGIGNIEIIKYLMKELQLDVNYKYKNGKTLLNVAIEHRQGLIGKFLIRNGSTFDNTDSTGRTTLHYASENGCLKISKLIVGTYSEIIDSVTNDNSTSLHLAAQNCHTEVVKFLLSKNANVNIKNIQGLSAFLVAAQNGHLNILEIFLHTFKYDLSSEERIRALHLATENGHCAVIKSLLLHAEENIKNEQMNLILHLASLHGHLNIITWLVCSDVDIHCIDTTNRTALHLASQSGHCEVVKQLLHLGIDPNIVDDDEWTAMHWASHNKHYDVVRLLLSNDSKVHIVDYQGNTAFHLAAQNGDANILNALLEFNADPNATTAKGRTALHLAAQNGCCGIVEILINTCQVNINALDINEETPIIVATDNGNNDVVELLLKHGAIRNSRSKKRGHAALSRAAAQGHVDILLNLINSKADIEIQDNMGWRPLHWAVQYGYTDILDVLLKHKVDVNAKYKFGGTALLTAIRNGHVDIVKKLLKYGANIKDMLLLKVLPVRVAAHFGHTDIVSMLLAMGAEVDAMGSDKVTPLHAASWNGHIEVVKLLIQHGANVNAKTDEEWSPSHFAAKFGFFGILQILMEKSADIYTENNFGANVFHIACEMDHVDIISMLHHVHKTDVNIRSSNGATGLHWASANGRINIVDALIALGANVNIGDFEESTPLHWAIQHSGCIQIVRALITNGGKVNVKDIRGATPLHLAAIKGNEEVVNELLQNKAHVNDASNVPPLHLATANGHRRIVKILLNRGAMVNSTSLHQRTCLHIAAEMGYTNIIQLLLKCGAKINLKNENGMTALHLAVQNRHEDITRLLVEHAIDINSFDNIGRTALHLALEHQFEDIAEFLIENNAEVQMKTRDGCTFLHRACQLSMSKVVLALLKRGVDPSAKNTFNDITPLLESLHLGYVHIANILIENRAEINPVTTTGWTPLQIAAGKGFHHIVHLLLRHGAHVNAKTVDGETALYWASLQGHSEIVNELLDNNATVEVKTLSKGLTPVSVAAQEGHTEILKTLIHHNADVNSKECQGLTPLHISALYGHLECVKALLENNVDINAVSSTGWTALHIAAAEGFLEIVEILILTNDIGIVNYKNDDGDTAVDLARKQGYTEVVAKLLDDKILM